MKLSHLLEVNSVEQNRVKSLTFKTAVKAIRACGGTISFGASKQMIAAELKRISALRDEEKVDSLKLTAAKIAVKDLMALNQ